MIKVSHGWIGTNDGRRKDIVAKAWLPNKVKDILIGGGIVLAGIAYLTVTAFKNGSKAYCEAEAETMEALGLLEDAVDDVT